jgi:hypothetical protein
MNENNISLLYITYFLFLFIPLPPPSAEGERWLLKYLPGVNATRNILLTNTSHTVHRFLYPVHPTQPPTTYSHPPKKLSHSLLILYSTTFNWLQFTTRLRINFYLCMFFVSYISFVWFNFYSGHEKVYLYRLCFFPLDHTKAGINMEKINILFLRVPFQNSIQASKGRVCSRPLLHIQFFFLRRFIKTSLLELK